MEKKEYRQLELFATAGENNEIESLGEKRSFFGYIRTHEKAVLVSIGFVIIGIVLFSLGVEKGKKLAMAPVLSAAIVAEPIKQTNNLKTNTNVISGQKVLIAPKAQSEKIITVTATSKGLLQSYTIQLASYQDRGLAEKEAAILKKKGFSPLVLNKGKYTILCVGNFPSKENANMLLSEFKQHKRYQGCYLRRL